MRRYYDKKYNENLLKLAKNEIKKGSIKFIGEVDEVQKVILQRSKSFCITSKTKVME